MAEKKQVEAKEPERTLSVEQYERYLDRAIDEARRGTCAPYLDGLDIAKADKAKLFAAASNLKRRALGRPDKENPFL